MKKLLSAAACGLLLSGTALADIYGGLSYGALETEMGSRDFDTPTLNIAIGNTFNPNIAIEGRIGFGIDDDSDSGVKAEIEDYFAIYAKPMLPLSDVLTLYGLIGIAETTIDTNFGKGDDDDISYGIGLSAKIQNGVEIFGEYISLYDDKNIEVSGFNLGATMRF